MSLATHRGATVAHKVDLLHAMFRNVEEQTEEGIFNLMSHRRLPGTSRFFVTPIRTEGLANTTKTGDTQNPVSK